ncbi:MAG: ATP-grasp domain-containing protein [Thermodesulfobacteriota bacterium]
MKVAILHDHVPEGAPPDLLDTLTQVREVQGILVQMGHEAQTLALSEHLSDTAIRLLEYQPDLVFNLVETVWGLGRFIHLAPELLEALEIPYTGAQSWPMRLTSNKLLAKKTLREAGLPTPNWLATGESSPGVRSGARVIIKSVWEHGSLGLEDDAVLFASGTKALMSEMKRRQSALGGDCFAEEFIEGREFTISMLVRGLEPEVLPPAETIFHGFAADSIKVVGYRAKWISDSFEYQNTPRCYDIPKRDKPLVRRLSELGLASWRLFGLSGYARVDFRVDQTGRPWILEINANPCLSSDAGFIAAAEEVGLDQRGVVTRITEEVSLKRRLTDWSEPRRCREHQAG